jgi:hypothetical protein
MLARLGQVLRWVVCVLVIAVSLHSAAEALDTLSDSWEDGAFQQQLTDQERSSMVAIDRARIFPIAV